MCVTPSFPAADFRQLHTLRNYGDRVLWRGEGPQGRTLVKAPTPEFAGDAFVREMQRREFEFLRRFAHDRIVRPLSFDAERAALYLEDAQCTLGQLLRQMQTMPVDLVVNVLHWAAAGLSVLHDQGIGHGSLQLHSLAVDVRGQVKLGDFHGYAFRAEPPPFANGLKYQAPEVLGVDHGAPSPSSDLYCLGFLALELLVGGQFDGLFGLGDDPDRAPNWLGWHADLGRKLEHWHDAAPHAPVGLRRIVDELIVKNPAERRFKTARHLLVELQEFQMESERRLPAFRGGGNVRRKVRPVVTPEPLTLTNLQTGRARRFSPNRSILVGRRDDCDVRLATRAGSQKHAYLAHQPDGWWIFDLHSRKGLTVNDKPLHRGRIKTGDVLKIGDDEFRAAVGAHKDEHRVNEFVLRDLVHRGQSGELYRAVWPKDGKAYSVAVRVYAADQRAEQAAVRRFLRSVPTVGRLRHPNILKLYRGGIPAEVDKGRMWLAMEYTAGGSMRDRLAKESRLAIAETLRVGCEVARGLAFAHRHGLVHGQLGPSCILFDHKNRVKVGDFGTAGDESATQLRPDPRGDVYSLAACLYEALVGQPPTSTANAAAPSVRTLRPEVPEALDNLLVAGLSQNPHARIASMEAFLAALEAITA